MSSSDNLHAGGSLSLSWRLMASGNICLFFLPIFLIPLHTLLMLVPGLPRSDLILSTKPSSSTLPTSKPEIKGMRRLQIPHGPLSLHEPQTQTDSSIESKLHLPPLSAFLVEEFDPRKVLHFLLCEALAGFIGVLWVHFRFGIFLIVVMLLFAEVPLLQ